MKYEVILLNEDGEPDWRHPNEIEAVDKEDAKSAIAECCPAENIYAVLTEKEYLSKNSKDVIMDSASYDDSKKYFSNMMNMALEQAQNNPSDEKDNENVNNLDPDIKILDNKQLEEMYDEAVKNSDFNNINNDVKIKSIPAKYFTDNGIMFKLENGILYKKIWTDVATTQILDESTGNMIPPEFRIVNAESNKPINSSKYKVQQLCWNEVELKS